MDDLIPDLQPVVLWMANSLELLHFFRENLSDYLLDAAVSLPPGTRQSLAQADQEVIAVLDEVVMYTFQQTIYYLTKVHDTNTLVTVEKDIGLTRVGPWAWKKTWLQD